MVVDLGGGTFDVSILEMFEGVMEVRATAGDAFLGGEDFTRLLADQLAKTAGADPKSLPADETAALLTLAESVKRSLSMQGQARFSGGIGQRSLSGTLTRADFEEISVPLIQRMRRPIERALHDARLGTGGIDRVVMAGGATRMPMIRSLVAKRLKKLPEVGLDPDHLVALGAAVQAALVARDAALGDVVMTDVSAFTLGMDISREVDGSAIPGFYLPIIERNTTVPVSREAIVHTIILGQTAIEVGVYQGEAPRVSNNILLGRLRLKVPRNMKEREQVAVRFTYDVSGLLEIEARSVSSGRAERLVIRNLAGEMTEGEIKARLRKLEALKIHPRDQAENRALQARLEQCYAMALGAEREHLQALLAEFEALINRQDPALLSAFRAEAGAQLDLFEDGYVS
jgi:molecular chaperone HscC